MVDNEFSLRFHAASIPIIGTFMQAETSDNRYCDYRRGSDNAGMTKSAPHQPEARDIFERMKRLGLKQVELARALELAENKISKVKNGERQFSAGEVLRACEWLNQVENNGEAHVMPDIMPDPRAQSYVEVEVIPTFGGMGGGGNGDGDPEIALVPRALIEDVLRGKANDFLLINVRGDSMEPDFRHGDQLLIDRRDKSPAQPGPFALWDAEWGEYVVKNVERAPGSGIRIFSSNSKYSDALVESEQTHIIGRPVWFGRRI